MDMIQRAVVIEEEKLELILATFFSTRTRLAGRYSRHRQNDGGESHRESLARRFQAGTMHARFTPLRCNRSAIYNQRDSRFEFIEGPLFANIVLVDEINRASPRTQSSLLEAMAEGQVTTDGTTRQLPSPFFIMATQNPVEMAGTFPLPEAQLDRFLVMLNLGIPII